MTRNKDQPVPNKFLPLQSLSSGLSAFLEAPGSLEMRGLKGEQRGARPPPVPAGNVRVGCQYSTLLRCQAS